MTPIMLFEWALSIAGCAILALVVIAAVLFLRTVSK
jgi:hypothetical protein